MNLKCIYLRPTKSGMRYDVKVSVKGKTINVGRFNSRKDAIDARNYAQGGVGISCSNCGVYTVQGSHTGTYCRSCYNVRSQSKYKSLDYVFLTEGIITPKQLARMKW